MPDKRSSRCLLEFDLHGPDLACRVVLGGPYLNLFQKLGVSDLDFHAQETRMLEFLRNAVSSYDD
jgi:hypothetical protein